MPNLPTISVTQVQADRMLAAFGSVAEYKEWLRQQIILKVVDFEVAQVRVSVTQQEIDKKAEVLAAMPSPPQQAADPGPTLPTP